MFFFFGLSGMVEVLQHYHKGLPEGLDYMVGAMAYGVEGLLFTQHLHGRSPMDIQLHELLYYSIFSCMISALLEMRYRGSVLAILTRSFFTLLQGTWFIQAAFVLYNPIQGATPWDLDSHSQMLMVTVYYTWHCAGNFLYMLCIYGLVRAWMNCKGQRQYGDDYHALEMRKLDLEEKADLLSDDSEEEFKVTTDLQT